MHYLDLNILTAQHLYGSWDVLEKPGGQAADASAFASCSRVVLQGNGNLLIESGRVESGTWEMFKEEEIIYNPQLNFKLVSQAEVINAIITRFREDDENGVISRKLTLYFDSGLELILEQKCAANS